jgi:exoribonuclease R
VPINRVKAPHIDFSVLRRELNLPAEFPAAAQAEAEASAAHPPAPARDATDIPFVTVDPAGSRDLDQALHLSRRDGGGYRVRYAIADVASFVTPGGALDEATWARGQTVYLPDGKVPLHPPVLSENAASLVPDGDRPAVLWTLDLDADGTLTTIALERALVRSRAQLAYPEVQAALDAGRADDAYALLPEIGALLAARAADRGAVNLPLPEQEVEPSGDGWTLVLRAPLPAEEHNAQLSLLTGMAAARLMLDAGIGILRTQPAPDEKAMRRFRLQVEALRVPWPEGMSYPELIRSLDPTVPAHAALMHEATGVGRGAGYTPFDGEVPPEHEHFSIAADYAHATAPLRRLQDRWVSECCLAASAGTAPPDWVRSGLEALPKAMAAGGHKAGVVERGVVDLVEAMLLEGRVGESFDALVVDDKLLQLREPAVRAGVEGACPEPGTEVKAKLTVADPKARRVEFSLA